MSYTILHGFREDGEICHINEYKNAHLGAFLVWMETGKKYGIKDVETMLLNEAKSKEVWGLARDKNVAVADRITMISTFDRCVVFSKDFNRLITALRESAKWLPERCHISKQADDIEKATNVIAVGWTQTSVASDVWSSNEMHIRIGFEIEEEAPYNLHKHNRHFDLFEEYFKVSLILI